MRARRFSDCMHVRSTAVSEIRTLDMHARARFQRSNSVMHVFTVMHDQLCMMRALFNTSFTRILLALLLATSQTICTVAIEIVRRSKLRVSGLRRSTTPARRSAAAHAICNAPQYSHAALPVQLYSYCSCIVAAAAAYDTAVAQASKLKHTAAPQLSRRVRCCCVRHAADLLVLFHSTDEDPWGAFLCPWPLAADACASVGLDAGSVRYYLSHISGGSRVARPWLADSADRGARRAHEGAAGDP